ncbi:MAG TPA: hypothetical protein VKH37_00290, partial [Ferruginibacter sp.]|nr:hypothetical protein [Ferruginibacter sp.]
MKSIHYICCFLLYFTVTDLKAQRYVNQGNYWPYWAPNGVDRDDADSTSEDWWYDVKTVPTWHSTYTEGRYIACGYSQFDDIGLGNLYGNDLCNIFKEINFNDPLNPSNFDLPDMRHMNTCSTIGLVNLTSSTSPENPYQWIWNYGLGSSLFRVIPTSDGGFLATGITSAWNLPYPTSEKQYQDYFSGTSDAAIYYQSPSSIPFNPPNKNAFAFPSCPPFSDPEKVGRKRHTYVVKVDQDGFLKWAYMYGIAPFDAADSIAYANSSAGTDLLEIRNGYIVCGIIQNSPTNGDYADHGFLMLIDRDGNLQWINQYHDHDFIAEKFTAMQLNSSSTSVYVTGERTKDIAGVFCTPPTYSPYSSNCINGANTADLEHPNNMKFLSFLKKIDISTGAEEWDLPLTTSTSVNSKARSLSVDSKGQILVGVSSNCTVNFDAGECQTTFVDKVQDYGTSAAVVQTINFGVARAYDLRTGLGVKATTDGGFLV